MPKSLAPVAVRTVCRQTGEEWETGNERPKLLQMPRCRKEVHA